MLIILLVEDKVKRKSKLLKRKIVKQASSKKKLKVMYKYTETSTCTMPFNT